jgi:hypothetical protein
MSISSSPEVKTGVRFWRAHVRALGGSGLSRREYCRRHHLSYHALTYWVRKLRPTSPRATPPALVEVPACSLPLLRRSGSAFRLHLDQGRLLEIESDFDEAGLGRLLRVLEQR